MLRPYTENELSDPGDSEHFDQIVTLKPPAIELYNPNVGTLVFLFLEMRIELIKLPGRPVNYFDYRHHLPPSTRRAMDIVFLIHGFRDHRDERWWLSVEGWRWKRLHRKYRSEFDYYVANPKPRSERARQFWDLYNEVYMGAYLELEKTERLDYFHRSSHDNF